MNNKNTYEKLIEISFGCDYHPTGGNIIYQVQNHLHCKELGLPTPGIEIFDIDNNEICGVVEENGNIIWY